MTLTPIDMQASIYPHRFLSVWNDNSLSRLGQQHWLAIENEPAEEAYNNQYRIHGEMVCCRNTVGSIHRMSYIVHLVDFTSLAQVWGRFVCILAIHGLPVTEPRGGIGYSELFLWLVS